MQPIFGHRLERTSRSCESLARRCVSSSDNRQSSLLTRSRSRRPGLKYTAYLAGSDTGAAQMIARWIRERLDAGEPMEAWTDALGSACASDWRHRPLDGAPALLRALCDAPETTPFAIALVSGRDNAPTTREGMLRLAETMEVEIAERAWWRRRDAAMTSDDIRAKP